jgi:hypothetical protein
LGPRELKKGGKMYCQICGKRIIKGRERIIKSQKLKICGKCEKDIEHLVTLIADVDNLLKALFERLLNEITIINREKTKIDEIKNKLNLE